VYQDVAEIFACFWQAYGGWRALIKSPYLHLAVLVTGITYKFWSQPLWWEQVISVIPSLLGFTLGGFAIFIGLGDGKFRALLAKPDKDNSNEPDLYIELCSSFVHFILIQVLSLIAALLAKSWWFYSPWSNLFQQILPILNLLGGAIGYGLFLYAITSILAATMHIFRIATWYEVYQRQINQKDD